jgi:hypothetical protein
MGIAVEQEHYDVKLGGRPNVTENGAASVRVVGSRHLRTIRYYPNNMVIIDLTVVGHSCVLKISHRLKRGERQYTFTNPAGGVAYCERPLTIRTLGRHSPVPEMRRAALADGPKSQKSEKQRKPLQGVRV